MTTEQLKQRTKKFSVDIINLTKELPQIRPANVICNQILRSATSVGANYRSACRARSKADFISKMTIVEEEADETLYWLELLIETGLIKNGSAVQKLLKEADELTAIFVSSVKTARINNNPHSTIRNPKSK